MPLPRSRCRLPTLCLPRFPLPHAPFPLLRSHCSFCTLPALMHTHGCRCCCCRCRRDLADLLTGSDVARTQIYLRCGCATSFAVQQPAVRAFCHHHGYVLPFAGPTDLRVLVYLLSTGTSPAAVAFFFYAGSTCVACYVRVVRSLPPYRPVAIFAVAATCRTIPPPTLLLPRTYYHKPKRTTYSYCCRFICR